MARSTTAVLGHLRWRGGFPQLDEAHGVVVVMVVDDLVDKNLVNSGEIHDGGRGGTRWRLAEGWPRLNSGDGICVSDVDSDVWETVLSELEKMCQNNNYL
ncbi:hypothetical protein M6B38_146770 [Iris pallida]|uniref:Uncharacterized protein n=1 Tax=Iris pallida TaxID=29817 RepID=A0AAX6FAE4_IRIPA|nr:hypothetical protein M6B38_146770 [Iris pallida]